MLLTINTKLNNQSGSNLEEVVGIILFCIYSRKASYALYGGIVVTVLCTPY